MIGSWTTLKIKTKQIWHVLMSLIGLSNKVTNPNVYYSLKKSVIKIQEYVVS